MSHKIYMRCSYCGDSQKDLSHKHLVIYMDSGSFHCFRCGVSGYLSLVDMLALAFNGDADLRTEAKAPVTEPPPGAKKLTGLGPLKRYSVVSDRYQVENEQGPIEVFESKNRLGKVTGFHLRASWEKITISYGILTIGYGNPDFTKPVRLVEGPYDAIYDEDLCVWGKPKIQQVRELKFVPLILCPDGDIFDDFTQFRSWFKPFIKEPCLIKSVEMLPPDSDPDEVEFADRHQLPWQLILDIYMGRIHGTANRPRDLVLRASKDSRKKIFVPQASSRRNLGGQRLDRRSFLQRST